MSLWLSFSGRAEKIDYEFEDICPHGPDRSCLLEITEHECYTTTIVFSDFSMLKLLQFCQYFFLAVFLLLAIHHSWNCSHLSIVDPTGIRIASLTHWLSLHRTIWIEFSKIWQNAGLRGGFPDRNWAA